jgi:general secretion pathway protein B
MSFILDALRKSEHERQRQSGPALAEVAVATRQPRSNVWAPVAIALLLVNLVVVGVLMIRKSMRDPATSPPAGAIADDAPAPASVGPAPAAQPPVVSLNPPAASAPASPPAVPPPSIPAAGANGAGNPLEAETADGSPMLDPGMAAQAAAPPPGPPAVTRMPASRGSVVYESLPDSATVGGPQYSPQPGAGRPAANSGAGLPGADELSGSGAVPALNLDLHVYSTTPSERMVFINSRKYREGDTMQEGPVVRQITPAGAVLEYNGRSYLLTHN